MGFRPTSRANTTGAAVSLLLLNIRHGLRMQATHAVNDAAGLDLETRPSAG
jgi:hypothetical protein